MNVSFTHILPNININETKNQFKLYILWTEDGGR